MMEELHVAITHLCRSTVYLLAPALRALRRLSQSYAWLWLAGVPTGETAAAFSLVLFHHLSGLLLATGTEIFRHG